MHVRVPDRAAAVEWYCEHLGFELIEAERFWADGIDGGPVQLTADGGRTAIAVFAGSDWLPPVPLTAGIAFTLELEPFVEFARSLPGPLERNHGEPLLPEHLIDFDLCFAYDFVDPWGNRFEINCRDHAGVRAALLVDDGIEPVRYWPASAYEAWNDRAD